METKICTRCKKEKYVSCFYKYQKRNVYRSNCRGCYNEWSREYGKKPHVKEKRNKKGDTWARKNLESWNEYIPHKANCEICNVEIFFNIKDVNRSIHFDHKSESCSIKENPKRWLLKHRFNFHNLKIWNECNFGVLCGKCNRSIPTKNRKAWLINLTNYVNK